MLPSTGADDVPERFIAEPQGVPDHIGLGRIPSLWWTLNPKYNSLYEIHRLNVRSALGRAAVQDFDGNTSDVRIGFVKAAPDIATFMIALRTELSMRVVMPALLPSSAAQPFLSMARFETGESGNPHFHGFAVGAGAPRVGRVQGDVLADPQSDRGEDSDDDGLEPVEVKHQEGVVVEAGPVEGDVAASRDEALSDESVEFPGGPAWSAQVPPPPAPASEPRPKRKRELRQRLADADARVRNFTAEELVAAHELE